MVKQVRMKFANGKHFRERQIGKSISNYRLTILSDFKKVNCMAWHSFVTAISLKFFTVYTKHTQIILPLTSMFVLDQMLLEVFTI